jgi:uncharacterized iron-regulated protein
MIFCVNFNERRVPSLFLAMAMVLVFTHAGYSQSVHHPGSGYIPQRVYDSNQRRFSDFEAMLADLALADVVFVGEQHDDPATHRLERAMLEGLARRQPNIIVAMEMFERDVQQRLDEYTTGRLSEEDFLKSSRPWPRYSTDYRPLVEFARAHGWRVVASNVPRRFASQVSKQGLEAIDAVPSTERKLIASQIQCPFDDYFTLFTQTMKNHQGTGGDEPDEQQRAHQRSLIERFYFAQCVKDETMAESIAGLLNPHSSASGSASERSLIIHFNGSFHSDYRLGAAARASRRLPKSAIKVVTVIPVQNLDTINADEYSKRGDFIIFSLRRANFSN